MKKSRAAKILCTTLLVYLAFVSLGCEEKKQDKTNSNAVPFSMNPLINLMTLDIMADMLDIYNANPVELTLLERRYIDPLFYAQNGYWDRAFLCCYELKKEYYFRTSGKRSATFHRRLEMLLFTKEQIQHNPELEHFNEFIRAVLEDKVSLETALHIAIKNTVESLDTSTMTYKAVILYQRILSF